MSVFNGPILMFFISKFSGEHENLVYKVNNTIRTSTENKIFLMIYKFIQIRSCDKHI